MSDSNNLKIMPIEKARKITEVNFKNEYDKDYKRLVSDINKAIEQSTCGAAYIGQISRLNTKAVQDVTQELLRAGYKVRTGVGDMEVNW